MGSDCSKSTDRSNIITKSSKKAYKPSSMAPKGYVGYGENDIIQVESIQRDDLMAINVIHRELKEQAQVFVLNNMIMAVQFFSDHKEVINRLRHVSASPEEKEMNKTLLKDETMECTHPDAIMEEVNKNIIFRTMDEYSKSENLVAKRIYIINDLIEVVKSDETPQYTSIDKPCYQVKIEECNRKGFLKLKQVENNAPILISREYEENYDPLPGPSSRSDSEYDYSHITDLRTPKPIEVDGIVERRDTLPESCFTHRKVKHVPDEDLDDDEEMRLEYLANLNEDDLFKKVIYINSQGFMKYFQNALFPASLGKSLGFTEEAIAMAKAIPGKIFCDEFDIETNVNKTFEIIPAVGIPWPDDQTFEFVYREDRPTIFDTRTGIKYRWPTNGPGGMIEEIRNMTAVLVPKGYAKKKGVNRDAIRRCPPGKVLLTLMWFLLVDPSFNVQAYAADLVVTIKRKPEDGVSRLMQKAFNIILYHYPKEGSEQNDLEWEINFPKAERYLEARMSHAQMKCMLLLLTLHKTFIAPVTDQNGLLPEHIRTHMYWECERDYRNWPEHRLGTKLLKVIKDLQQKLFLGSLPDYFIKDRNLFENIPKKYLNYAQKVILEILNNPVPYFIKAMRNLRYSSGKFYPPFNFNELYEGLTVKSSATLVNPHLNQSTVPQLKRRLYKDPDQQMKHLKYLKKKEQIMRNRLKEKEEEQKAKEREEMLLVEDDINVDDPIDKELDIWKTKAILVIFIKNFIDIAKKSSNLATAEQALFYLKQASYLSKILEDTSASFLDEIREYRQLIAVEEARIKRKSVRTLSTNEEKPPTPQRNSISFQYNEINQQLKSGSVRLNNLQTSYMNGMQPPPAMRNLKPVQRTESYKQNGTPPKRKTVAFVE